MQRFFDIIFSGLALLVLAPIMIPVMIALRLSGEGEVFFFQERIGLEGRPFQLFKFATMLKDSPNLGTGTITVKGDPRILPMGKILRKTKINELPQLLNIFLGNMSVIGPRPLTWQTFCAYSSTTQEVIKKVKPGLSGIGSIIFRNEEEILSDENSSVDYYIDVIAPYKGALEEWYVNNRNLKTYFCTIGLTVWVILFRKSSLVWRIFKNLPVPSDSLKRTLNFSG